MKDFVEQMNTKQFKEIETFFTTMPKLSHKVKVKNPKTKVSYISIITDMDLIDNTKNKFKPKVEDLKLLKSKILNNDNIRNVHPIQIRNSN